jgi:hypothetical protein
MAKFLQLTLWNANSLSQHTEELKTFISVHNIDVMLISYAWNFPPIQPIIWTIQLELLRVVLL